jgi:hypothetical protein
MKKNARLTEAKPSAQGQAHSITRARVKALIVSSACLGVLPYRLAEWLIKRGGLCHD